MHPRAMDASLSSHVCYPRTQHVLWTIIALVAALEVVSSTYVVQKKFEHYHEGANSARKPYRKSYGPPFSSDKDVRRYLKLFGRDAMIWRCKNAIQPYWNWQPLPVVELYCEAIGSLKGVNWYHNGKKLDLGSRYKQAIYPHHYNNKYYSSWIDFRLRIYNATHRDSGVFTLEVIGKRGSRNIKNVYVDISEKRRKRKGKSWLGSPRRHKKDTIATDDHSE